MRASLRIIYKNMASCPIIWKFYCRTLHENATKLSISDVKMLLLTGKIGKVCKLFTRSTILYSRHFFKLGWRLARDQTQNSRILYIECLLQATYKGGSARRLPQTAKMKLLPSLFSCVYSKEWNYFYLQWIVGDVILFLCAWFTDLKKIAQNQTLSLPFAVCRLPLTSCLTSLWTTADRQCDLFISGWCKERAVPFLVLFHNCFSHLRLLFMHTSGVPVTFISTNDHEEQERHRNCARFAWIVNQQETYSRKRWLI